MSQVEDITKITTSQRKEEGAVNTPNAVLPTHQEKELGVLRRLIANHLSHFFSQAQVPPVGSMQGQQFPLDVAHAANNQVLPVQPQHPVVPPQPNAQPQHPSQGQGSSSPLAKNLADFFNRAINQLILRSTDPKEIAEGIARSLEERAKENKKELEQAESNVAFAQLPAGVDRQDLINELQQHNSLYAPTTTLAQELRSGNISEETLKRFRKKKDKDPEMAPNNSEKA